jgi:plasmid rolling circle replication initiator protein Rep
MEKNKTAKGITFGREDSFSNGKISNQYVYYNNNYVGSIRKTYVLNKKTGSYYDHIYNKHVFIKYISFSYGTNIVVVIINILI